MNQSVWVDNNLQEIIMKRVLGIICVVLFIVGCGGGGGSPSSALRQFYTALEKNDTKAMEAVATPETMALIALFGEKAGESVSGFGKITDIKENIDGDKAVLNVTFANGENTDVDMIKVDGKWKVTIGK